jgi:hypothetical protein
LFTARKSITFILFEKHNFVENFFFNWNLLSLYQIIKSIKMTITIFNSTESSKFEKLLQFLYQERIAFSFEPTISLSEEDIAIKERLRAKYVASGQWNGMNLDQKEDAALLETMLYDRENGVELLNADEQTDFLNELRDLAKVAH